ncbi:tandem-95 repeat protein [Candidatus Woesearchaeota archaeon]|nr:tandem-95 repeat protein [Candidatus Woesearchaeota archaeon]
MNNKKMVKKRLKKEGNSRDILVIGTLIIFIGVLLYIGNYHGGMTGLVVDNSTNVTLNETLNENLNDTINETFVENPVLIPDLNQTDEELNQSNETVVDDQTQQVAPEEEPEELPATPPLFGGQGFQTQQEQNCNPPDTGTWNINGEEVVCENKVINDTVSLGTGANVTFINITFNSTVNANYDSILNTTFCYFNDVYIFGESNITINNSNASSVYVYGGEPDFYIQNTTLNIIYFGQMGNESGTLRNVSMIQMHYRYDQNDTLTLVGLRQHMPFNGTAFINYGTVNFIDTFINPSRFTETLEIDQAVAGVTNNNNNEFYVNDSVLSVVKLFGNFTAKFNNVSVYDFGLLRALEFGPDAANFSAYNCSFYQPTLSDGTGINLAQNIVMDNFNISNSDLNEIIGEHFNLSFQNTSFQGFYVYLSNKPGNSINLTNSYLGQAYFGNTTQGFVADSGMYMMQFEDVTNFTVINYTGRPYFKNDIPGTNLTIDGFDDRLNAIDYIVTNTAGMFVNFTNMNPNEYAQFYMYEDTYNIFNNSFITALQTFDDSVNIVQNTSLTFGFFTENSYTELRNSSTFLYSFSGSAVVNFSTPGILTGYRDVSGNPEIRGYYEFIGTENFNSFSSSAFLNRFFPVQVNYTNGSVVSGALINITNGTHTLYNGSVDSNGFGWANMSFTTNSTDSSLYPYNNSYTIIASINPSDSQEINVFTDTFSALQFEMPITLYCGDTVTQSTVLAGHVLNATGGTECPTDRGIIISGNDIVFDCDGYNITGTDNGTGYGVEVIQAHNNITIKNCNVNGWLDGIVPRTENVTIYNNTLKFNNISIYVSGASSTADNNNITFNLISQSGTGIEISKGNHSITYNNITDTDINHGSGWGINLGLTATEYDFSNYLNNLTNGIYFGVNQTISGVTFPEAEISGIYLGLGGYNSILDDVLVSSNASRIIVVYGPSNTINNSRFSGNNENTAMEILSAADGVNITGNQVNNSFVGMYLYSPNTNVIGNEVHHNNISILITGASSVADNINISFNLINDTGQGITSFKGQNYLSYNNVTYVNYSKYGGTNPGYGYAFYISSENTTIDETNYFNITTNGIAISNYQTLVDYSFEDLTIESYCLSTAGSYNYLENIQFDNTCSNGISIASYNTLNNTHVNGITTGITVTGLNNTIVDCSASSATQDLYMGPSGINNTIVNSEFASLRYGLNTISQCSGNEFENVNVTDIALLYAQINASIILRNSIFNLTLIQGLTINSTEQSTINQIWMGGNATIDGFFNITDKSLYSFTSSAYPIRYYPIQILDYSGTGVESEVNVTDSLGNNIYSDVTNSTGYIRAPISFNNTNYNDEFTLSASYNPTLSQTINLTTDTQITLQEEPVYCGDTIYSNTALQRNLLNATGGDVCNTTYGLIIGANDIVLDCGGYNITGNWTVAGSSGSIGVGVGNYDNITVRNCGLHHWNYGLNNGWNLTVYDSNFSESNVGVSTNYDYLNVSGNRFSHLGNGVLNGGSHGIIRENIFSVISGNYSGTDARTYAIEGGNSNNITILNNTIWNATNGIRLGDNVTFSQHDLTDVWVTDSVLTVGGSNVIVSYLNISSVLGSETCLDIQNNIGGVRPFNITATDVLCGNFSVSGMANYGFNVTFRDNTIIGNTSGYGIVPSAHADAVNNTLYRNNITNVSGGIQFQSGVDINVIENNITNVRVGIYDAGDNSVICSNSIRNVTVYSGGWAIDSGNSDGSTICKDNDIQDVYYGIRFGDNIEVRDWDFTRYEIQHTVMGVGGKNSHIENITINCPLGCNTGIQIANNIGRSSDNNTLTNVNVTNNYYGIYLGTSSNNTVYDVNMSGNTWDVAFAAGYSNVVEDSNISTFLTAANVVNSSLVNVNSTSNTQFTGGEIFVEDSSFFGDFKVYGNSVVNFTSQSFVEQFTHLGDAGFGTNATIDGFVNISNKELQNNIVQMNNVTRYYPVQILDYSGSGVESEINVTNNNTVNVFSGVTNSTGYIRVPVKYNSTYYDGQFTLSASFNPTLTETINLTTDTQITLQEEPVYCGDTITTDTVLQRNVVNATDGEWCDSHGIIIGADNITLDCAGYSITGVGYLNGTAYGIFTNNKANLTIKNCYVNNFSHGIYLSNIDNSTVYNDTINNSIVSGIFLYYSDLDNISSNNVYNTGNHTSSYNVGNGIGLYNGGENLIIDNYVYNSFTDLAGDYRAGNGIYLTGSATYYNNIISHNNLVNSTYGGIGVFVAYDNYSIIYNNVYNSTGVAIRANSGNNVNVSGNDINSASSYGIFSASSNLTLCQNNLTDISSWAIYAATSDNATICKDNDIQQSYGGIVFGSNAQVTDWDFSGYNIINNVMGIGGTNSVYDNITAYCVNGCNIGIYLGGGPNINASNNVITNINVSNNIYGIEIEYAADNVLDSVDISNTTTALRFAGGSGTLVRDSNITSVAILDFGNIISINTTFLRSNLTDSLNLQGNSHTNFDNSTIFGALSLSYNATANFTSQSIINQITSVANGGSGNNAVMAGYVNITNKVIGSGPTSNNNFTRIYPVQVYDYTGTGVQTDVNITDADEVNVFSDQTNSTGFINALVVYNSSNYQDAFTITGSFNPVITQEINITDDTLYVLQETDIIRCGDTITSDTVLQRNVLNSTDGEICGETAIIIGNDNIVFDCAGYSITGDRNQSAYGIYAFQMENVTVKNCNVNSFGIGLYLRSSHNSTALLNTMNDSLYDGIQIYLGNLNNLTGNEIHNTGNVSWDIGVGLGIHINGGYDNVLGDNYIYNSYSSYGDRSGSGIFLQGTGGRNIVKNNTVENATDSCIEIYNGNDNTTFIENNVYNCSAFGIVTSSGTYNINYSGNLINNTGSQGIITSATNPSICGNNIYNTGSWAIDTINADNATICRDNDLQQVYRGIRFGDNVDETDWDFSSYVVINTVMGIGGFNSTFDNITAYCPTGCEFGIDLGNNAGRIATNNTITNVNVSNSVYGINIFGCFGNTIEYVDISNTTYSIRINGGSGNLIKDSNLSSINVLAGDNNTILRANITDYAIFTGVSNATVDNSTLSNASIISTANVNFTTQSTVGQFYSLGGSGPPIIDGYLNIINKTVKTFSANLTRYFPAYVYFRNGSTASNAIINVTDGINTVYNSSTDATGLASLKVVFNTSNYQDGFNITATWNPTGSGSLNLTANTPLNISQDDIELCYQNVSNVCTVKTGENCSCLTEALNNSDCYEVRLNSSITGWVGTCIDDPLNFTNKTLDCQAYTIDGDDSGTDYGLDFSLTDNIIKNCIVRDFDIGIKVSGSFNTFLNNTFTSSATGLRLNSGSNDVLLNTFSDDILYVASAYNNLTHNTISSAADGIYLSGSNNYVYNNTLIGNTDGMEVPGNNNTIIYNNITGTSNRGVYIVGGDYNNLTHNLVTSAGVYSILLNLGTYNLIVNNSIDSNVAVAVGLLGSSNNNQIENNTVQNGPQAFMLLSSSYSNNFTNNSVTGATYGFYLSSAGTNNRFENNSALGNNYGFYVTTTSTTFILNNTILGSSVYGIQLDSTANNNTIEYNDVQNSGRDGLIVGSTSSNNTVNSNNLCFNNQDTGSYFDIRDANITVGDDNTCDTVSGFNDTGSYGCTYLCTGTCDTYDAFIAVPVPGIDYNLTFTINVSTNASYVDEGNYTINNLTYSSSSSLIENETDFVDDLDTETLADGNYNISTLLKVADNCNILNVSSFQVHNNNPPNLSFVIPEWAWPEDIVNDTLVLGSYFEDPDNDDLNFTYYPVTNITLTIDNDTTIVTMTPDENFTGVRYTNFTAWDIDDEFNVSNLVVLNVTPVNDAPYLNATIYNLTWPEDTVNDSLYLVRYFTDIDGDDLNFTYYLVQNISIVIDNDTGQVVFTSEDNFSGVRLTNFTAYDPEGLSAVSNQVLLTVTEVNDNPVLVQQIINITWPEDTVNDTVNISEYFNDIDGDDLNYTYSAVQNITIAINNDTGKLTLTPDENFTGTRTTTFTAYDSDGASVSSNSVVLNVTPVNDAPNLNATINNVTWPEDSINDSLYLVRYFTDIDGDDLNFTYVAVTNITISIDNDTGLLILTPYENFTGVRQTVFTAIDPYGASISSNTVWLNVTPVNDPPYLNATIYNVTWPEDTVNDSLYLVRYFTDIDGDDLNFTYAAVTNITIFIDNDTGMLTLTPDDNFTGIRQTVFTAIDTYSATVNSNTVWLNVTPVNDNPGVDIVPNWTFPEDTVNDTLNLSNYFLDIDGDDLNFSHVSVLNITIVIDNDTHKVTFTPDGNFTGTRTTSFTAYDPQGLFITSNNVLINVTNVNDPPYITSTAVTNATEAQVFTYNMTAIDIDGDSLVFAVNDTVRFSQNLANFSWTPQQSDVDASVRAFRFNVSDGNGGSDEQIVYIGVTNANDPPNFTLTIENITWNEDTVNSSLNLSQHFEDPDGDDLNYTATSVSNIGIAIDNDTGIVTLTPAANYSGFGTTTFTAYDPSGQINVSNVVVLNVTPVNDPPYLVTNIPNLGITQNTNRTYDVSSYFADVDGDDLNYSAISIENITIYVDNDTSVFTFEPETNFLGIRYLTIYAFDPSNENATSNNITLTVSVGFYCGDGNCDANESCDTCPEDCGSCLVREVDTSPAGRVYGCVENWQCTDWGECQPDGYEYRTCTDMSICDQDFWEATRPDEKRECVYTPICTDGVRNGDETGIDCGGSCPACELDVEEEVVDGEFVLETDFTQFVDEDYTLTLDLSHIRGLYNAVIYNPWDCLGRPNGSIEFMRIQDVPLQNSKFTDFDVLFSYAMPEGTDCDVEFLTKYVCSSEEYSVYKCTEWDMENKRCKDDDSWVTIAELKPGLNKIKIKVKGNDPGLGIGPSPIRQVCGNLVCDSGEDCVTCPSDCVCEEQPAKIGFIAKIINFFKSITGGAMLTLDCREDWSCPLWSEWNELGYRTRKCVDTNQCGRELYKPLESEYCEFIEEGCSNRILDQNEEGVDCGGVCDPCLAVPYSRDLWWILLIVFMGSYFATRFYILRNGGWKKFKKKFKIVLRKIFLGKYA